MGATLWREAPFHLTCCWVLVLHPLGEPRVVAVISSSVSLKFILTWEPPLEWCRPLPCSHTLGPQFSKVTAVSASPTSMPGFQLWAVRRESGCEKRGMGEPEGRHILCSSFNPPPEATPTLPGGKSTEETRVKLQAWGWCLHLSHLAGGEQSVQRFLLTERLR